MTVLAVVSSCSRRGGGLGMELLPSSESLVLKKTSFFFGLEPR